MKLNFKIFSLIAISLLSIISFASCKEDDWEPLKWTVDNMNPENIVVKTHPDEDPESQKFIIANEEGGEIIFYCENYDDLYLAVNEYGNTGDTVNNDDLSVKLDGDKLT